LTSSSIFQVLPEGSSLILESLDHNPQMLHHWVGRDPGCEGNDFPSPQTKLLGASKCKFRCLAATHHHTSCNHLPHGRRGWCDHIISTCLNLGPLVDPSVINKTMRQLISQPSSDSSAIFSILHGRPLPSAAAPRPWRPLLALLPFGFGMARPAAPASSRPPGPPLQQANPPGQRPVERSI